MKTARRFLTVTVFILFLLAAFIVLVVLPKDETSAAQENRNLAEMPKFSFSSLFSGEFMTDFETYLSDNVGFRSVFNSLSSGYKSYKGINSFGKIVETNGDMGTGEATKSRLLVIDDRVMEVYCVDDEAREQYIDMVNFYAEKLPSSINLYSMLIPTQVDFMPFYSTVGDSQSESIRYFSEHFSERVKNISVYDTLKEHFLNDEYVYFRTDHHWTQLGAYYAYEKMSESMDFTTVPIEEFEKNSISDFTGYLYSQAEASYLSEHKDSIDYYKSVLNDLEYSAVTYSYIPGEAFNYSGKMFDLGKGASYTMFLGGDQPYIEINTLSGNKKTLVMIKDSYSNALIPWLACSYSKIIVIDARTFDQSITKVLNTVPVDDFLITNYIMGTNFKDYIKMCKDIY